MTMETAELERAVEAARSVAAASGLRADGAVVVNNSNRIAVHLTPCDVLARVAPVADQARAEFEVSVARHLAETDAPVAGLDPRAEPVVHLHEGFAVTLWAYYEAAPPAEITPTDYAHALAGLHVSLREMDLHAPHFSDRVAEARRLVADPEQTPDLVDADRELLGTTLTVLGAAVSESKHGSGDQLLHGEPHPGNVLATRKGLLFIDLETCCRGPIEFDLAHGLFQSDARTLALADLYQQYPGADEDVVEQCRTLIWAMITTWRWDRSDQLPNGNYWRTAGLEQLRPAR